MMFGNMIARNFGYVPYQLSFYDSNFLTRVNQELERVSTINKNFDILIMELDYMLQDETILENTLSMVLKQLNLFRVKKILLWYALPSQYNQKANLCKDIVNLQFKERLNKDVFFINIKELWDRDKVDTFTYSDEFINDAANVYLFKEISKYLEKIEWNI